jgi:8-oxo-dGTP pyrophosphatase MutT (NUDIX family)
MKYSEREKSPGSEEWVEQAAAICCRVSEKGHIEVLLLSSRDTGRWVIPKGFIEKKETSFKAAQREALEEAGVVGKVRKRPIGRYIYRKDGGRELTVVVHLLRFDRAKDEFREKSQRNSVWLAPIDAARLVDEPKLKDMLSSIDMVSPLTSQDRSLLRRIARRHRSSSGFGKSLPPT